MSTRAAAFLAGATLAGLALAVPPAAAASLLPAACPASTALTKLDMPLTKLAARLAGDQPVVIVAIGSSSTAGAGASSAQASYPSRLEALLRERYPGRDIRVVNRGINGQDQPEMMARFDADVVALKPAVVLWQGGVNAMFRDNGLGTAESILREAIRRTREIGADFVIIDPQYAPRVIADADSGPMVKLMNTVAAEEAVPVFHRFALMRDWHERGGMPFEAFLAKDSFHMNDWSYDCLARDLARSIGANVEAQQRSAEAAPKPGSGLGGKIGGKTGGTPASAELAPKPATPN